MKDLDRFYHSLQEPNRGCLLALRQLILNWDDQITEDWKYKMPCFCFKGKVFCYLWVDKKLNWPYILIVRGNQIEYPGLEQGDRSKMKRFLLDPGKDIPVEAIYDLFNLLRPLYS